MTTARVARAWLLSMRVCTPLLKPGPNPRLKPTPACKCDSRSVSCDPETVKAAARAYTLAVAVNHPAVLRRHLETVATALTGSQTVLRKGTSSSGAKLRNEVSITIRSFLEPVEVFYSNSSHSRPSRAHIYKYRLTCLWM